MLNSLKLYTRYFSATLVSDRKRRLLYDQLKRSGLKELRNVQAYSREMREEALDKAVDWLLHAQETMLDDGFGSYHLVNGWSSSYPETSGYIIPSLLDYSDRHGNRDMIAVVTRAADWLIRIQKPSGGWQGGRVNENKPEIVFNTGQIIRGMTAMYRKTGKQKYLDAAIRAADWLCDIQHPEGYWKDFALMNKARVYDSYVDAPVLDVWQITGNDKYKDCAVKNLDWILREKQKENGWFADCDNTEKRNYAPILHTISYTVDGILDCGTMLQEDKYIRAAKNTANTLLEKFTQNGYLNSRWDENWKGTEYMMPTGCAQVAIIWLKLAGKYHEKKYYDAASRMTDLLIHTQDRGKLDTKDTRGAMPGSFPLWGRYEPFAFPNWATKYFVDLLILEQKTLNG